MNQLEPTNTTALVAIPDAQLISMQRALAGDLSKLPEDEKLAFFGTVCRTTGLNPTTKPFDWITFQQKMTLYPNKGCAEQLRQIHKVSCDVGDFKIEFGCLIVKVKGSTPDGRTDSAYGAVPFFDGMKGESAANAIMKAETKAKRRMTLSICGLGWLDIAGVEDSVNPERARDPLTATAEESAGARVDRLNAQLTAGEKSTAIPISESTQPVAQAATVETPLAAASSSAPEVPAAALPAGQPNPQPAHTPVSGAGLLSEDEVRNLEIALGEYPQPKRCVDYMEFKGAKKKGEGMATLRRNWFTLILANPANFFEKVDAWVKEGK